jgi:hypothetical protein
MYHRVAGWTQPRDQGGTNSIRLRQANYAQWICVGCMEEAVCKDDTKDVSGGTHSSRENPPVVFEHEQPELPQLKRSKRRQRADAALLGE